MLSLFICTGGYGVTSVKQMNLFAPPSSDTRHVARKKDVWTLYIDGASRNNPGPSGAGIHLLKNGESIERLGYYLGTKTNNQAEYFALLLGMLMLKKYAHIDDDAIVISDSQLLVKQLKGEYRVKDPILKILFSLAHALLYSIKAHISHVLREDNVVADKMANQGIDKKIPIPSEFVEVLRRHEITI